MEVRECVVEGGTVMTVDDNEALFERLLRSSMDLYSFVYIILCHAVVRDLPNVSYESKVQETLCTNDDMWIQSLM